MLVSIDGVPYAPASSAAFGVAITTRNRPAKLAKTVAQYRQHTPPDVPIIVVDDQSDPPVDCDYRFPVNVGIATAKNKCIELLLAAGVQHLFLSDDDAYPIADNWWQPYVQSPEPHLFAVFPTPTAKSSKIEELFRDDRHIAYHATRGYFLYVHRRVVDRVGGFDARFRNAFEHVEFSNRVHNAGLTSWPYQDVVGSEALIFAEDSRPGNDSVIPNQTRTANEQAGRQLLADCEGRDTFVPFGTRDIVLTCLFTGQPDPQRRRHLQSDPALVDALIDSVPGETVVLCDFPCDRPEFVTVTGGLNPYIQRWVSYRTYLVSHPEVRWVWCVDGTDVEALKDPFAGMQPEILYTGWENQVVGCPWMRDNHAASRPWIDTNPDRPLLNAGVVGADRATMLQFCATLIRLWATDTVAKKSDAAGDMALFNRAAATMTVQTGPPITTLFKANEPNTWSKWRHK